MSDEVRTVPFLILVLVLVLPVTANVDALTSTIFSRETDPISSHWSHHLN